jgi:hypothetical protein
MRSLMGVTVQLNGSTAAPALQIDRTNGSFSSLSESLGIVSSLGGGGLTRNITGGGDSALGFRKGRWSRRRL